MIRKIGMDGLSGEEYFSFIREFETLQNRPNKYIKFQISKFFTSVPACRKLVALFRSRYDRLEENTEESTNVVQETQEHQENGNH